MFFIEVYGSLAMKYLHCSTISENHDVNQKSALEVALCTGGPRTVEVMELYMRIPEIFFQKI